MVKFKVCTRCKTEKEASLFAKLKKSKSGLQSKCKQCNKIYRVENKDHIKNYKDNYRKENSIDLAKKQREYASNNREYATEYQRKWMNNKRKNDIVFNLKCRLRYLIRYFLEKNNCVKNLRTSAILGCSCEFFKCHIESQFTEGMSWERISEIHIDHIIPMASAITEEDVLRLNHYTNLQPLWAADNLKKGSMMPPSEVCLLIIKNYNEAINKITY
jgi:hypothetical protein